MKTLTQFINEGLFPLRDYRRIVKRHETVKPNDVTELKYIIRNTIKDEGNECDLNFIDTSKITDMSSLFHGSDFNGDISDWDVSKVVDMNNMFYSSKFTGDISNWDVSNVKYMYGMFANTKFNGDISDWDVSNVTNMAAMFYSSKFNGDISKWQLKRVPFTRNMFIDSPLQKIYGEDAVIKKGHFVKI